MSENSKIEWTDHTFNPWEGCTKVGPGCDHCYAEVRNARYAGGQSINWGAGASRRRTSEANWKLPIKWNKEADTFFAEHGRRQRVFCASLADVFDNEVDSQWRHDLFALIQKTPNLDYLLLTKRIGNVQKLVDLSVFEELKNIWLGATVVNQEEADRDIPKLLDVPAAVRFLSIEPLLAKIDLKYHFVEPTGEWCTHKGKRQMEMVAHNKLHWVIVGGESGAGARPMHPDWARSLRNQCEAVKVPYLFKQWGEFMPADDDECDPGIECSRLFWSDGEPFRNGQRGGVALMAKVGKHKAGRMLDGITHDGYPSL